MNKEEKKVLVNSLNLLKEEIKQRFDFAKHGIDLANYESKYYDAAMVFILFYLKGQKELVEWWLFDNVEKKITINNKTFDVEKSEDFIEFLIKYEL